MKRSITVAAFCLALLFVEAAFLLEHSAAEGDVVQQLLDLPAPPPPNPLVIRNLNQPYGEAKTEIPADNAPFAEIWAFWSNINIPERSLGYRPKMSDKTFERIREHIERKPEDISSVLGGLDDSERSYELVKRTMDRLAANGEEGVTGDEASGNEDQVASIREWLVMHSPYYTAELLTRARTTADTDTYVQNQEELLALTRFDFDKARPIIDEMYARDEDKATHVLARWALYRHAIESGSSIDADRYRDELKAIVEDKNLRAPLRDLAMDALVTEPEWPGRDEWYFSLLGDKTLHDLDGYTGLTTLINVSPPGKYSARMLEVLNSGDGVARAAAVRNLLINVDVAKPEVLAALLPWLEDPNWAEDTKGDSRLLIVNALQKVKLAEGVQPLIRLLFEENPKASERKVARTTFANTASNAAVMAARSAANAANAMANTAVSATPAGNEMHEERFPFRDAAIPALGFQGRSEAGPPLRRILSGPTNSSERAALMKALIQVRGFSIPEQADALEASVRDAIADPETLNSENWSDKATVATPASIKKSLGYNLQQDPTLISEDLSAVIVNRIDALSTREPAVAQRLREVALDWISPSVDSMTIRDVKRGTAEMAEVLRVLARRSELNEAHANEVFDMRQGVPLAAAVSACVLDDQGAYDSILDGASADAKRALFACTRLVRAHLPLEKVFSAAKSPDKMLSEAAVAYLTAEDSPQARNFILSMFPGEIRILGATSAFKKPGVEIEYQRWLTTIFSTVLDDPEFYSWYVGGEDELMTIEKRLREEVRSDATLVGIYGYDSNYVRIYNDHATYSWEEDPSRFRERTLEPAEFDDLKSYLAQNNVDSLPPFIECAGDYCEGKELVMLGRTGGRRVFMSGEPGAFFKGLDKIFANIKSRPSTVKYALSREIPSLELLLADDRFTALTIWKEGDDLRVAVSDTAVRKNIEEEIEEASRQPGSDKEPWRIVADLTVKRKFEGYSWRKLTNSSLGGAVAQPQGVELVPVNDGVEPRREQTQWKARVGTIEYRSEEGLFRVSGGRAEKIAEGSFASPLVTPDGKWVIAYQNSEDGNSAPSLVRFNTITKKIFPVKGLEEYTPYRPAIYIPNIKKVLITVENEYESEVSSDSLSLLDPETGLVTPASGEFRPLAQQTFRPLERASVPGTFWAAIPDSEKNSTSVGIYDARSFRFRIVRTIPTIQFNSMDMWVDEAAHLLYFVYKGHVLRLPLVDTPNGPK